MRIILSMIVMGLVCSCDSRRIESQPSDNPRARELFEIRTKQTEVFSSKLQQIHQSARRFHELYGKALGLLKRESDTPLPQTYSPVDLFLDVISESDRGIRKQVGDSERVLVLNFLEKTDPCHRIKMKTSVKTTEIGGDMDQIRIAIEDCRGTGALTDLLVSTWVTQDLATIEFNMGLLESFFETTKREVEKESGCVLKTQKLDFQSMTCKSFRIPLGNGEFLTFESFDSDIQNGVFVKSSGQFTDGEGKKKASFYINLNRNPSLTNWKVERE